MACTLPQGLRDAARLTGGPSFYENYLCEEEKAAFSRAFPKPNTPFSRDSIWRDRTVQMRQPDEQTARQGEAERPLVPETLTGESPALPAGREIERGSGLAELARLLVRDREAPAPELQRAREILDGRAELMRECQAPFTSAAAAISSEYTIQTKQPGYEGLSYATVNAVFGALVDALPQAARALWPGFEAAHEGSPLFKVFSWSFNRMKDRETSGEERIRIKSRGEIDGQPLPYPMHTHLDVPYCMRALGYEPALGATALAACHDAFEEGNGIRIALEKIDLRSLDLKDLIGRFPDEGLGRQLSAGIPALTESEYVDVALRLPVEAIEEFEDFARPLYPAAREAFPERMAGVTKIHLQDPLVFGGLALQIRDTLEEIAKLASEPEGAHPLGKRGLEDLAENIVRVELADRLSDMATLDRQIDDYPEDLDYARYRIVAYASRMLNMHDQIERGAESLPEEARSRCELARGRYIAVLAEKIEESSRRLEAEGARSITLDDVRNFHERIFRPIQAKADEVMREFLKGKIGGYLEDV